MSLRIQKKWSQLGNPQVPGEHKVKVIGQILDVTIEHIEQAEKQDDAMVVLEHAASQGMTPVWKIVSIGAP